MRAVRVSMSNKSFVIHPFEKLKKKIESKHSIPASIPLLQKKKKQFTEEELFSSAMNDVQEIEEFRTLTCTHHPKKPMPHVTTADRDRKTLEILGEIAEGRRPICLRDTQEYVEWTNPDCPVDIIVKLHTGLFSIQAFLDLHGCSVSEAKEEMDHFFEDSFKKGLRCVKIIHGRGLRSTKGPRIKDAVIKRLSGHHRKKIIAYVTARQCDGGLGALYILLREKSDASTWFRIGRVIRDVCYT